MSDHPEGSPERLPSTAVEHFRVQSPVTTAERAWRLVADTEWMSRTAGNGALLRMDTERQPDGFLMLVGEMGAPLGMSVPFGEVWSSWVHQSFFRQVRDLRSPIAARSDYRASLEPCEGGVRAVVEMSLTGPGWATFFRRALSLSVMERKWAAALQGLGEPETEVFGPALRKLDPEAAAAVRRWRENAETGLVDLLERHYRCARPADLGKIRPFELADRWGVSRDALLDTLLTGVDAGASELYWSMRCVRCYGQVAQGRLLSDLADHADCPACGITTATDLGENVEVLFAPHPSVVRELEVNFCTVYPARAPAQHVVLTLAAGQALSLPVSVPAGHWRLGRGDGFPDVDVHAGEEGSSDLRWRLDSQGTMQVRAGEITLDVANDSPQRIRLHLTRNGGAAPVVPASLLTTRESFRRRLGHQVLAPDLRIGVRSVAFLFTDLSGSTAMYEELGDARAFAVVRDHFAILRAATSLHDGTVVKTIGDAVMASFYDATAALAAAIEMQAKFNAWVPSLGMEQPLTLKVGVHVGSALVVHSDQAGIDYFGGTVNLAARAQGAAMGGDIVFTDAVATQSRVLEFLGKQGITKVSFTTRLKGLGDVQLWRIRPEG